MTAVRMVLRLVFIAVLPLMKCYDGCARVDGGLRETDNGQEFVYRRESQKNRVRGFDGKINDGNVTKMGRESRGNRNALYSAGAWSMGNGEGRMAGECGQGNMTRETGTGEPEGRIFTACRGTRNKAGSNFRSKTRTLARKIARCGVNRFGASAVLSAALDSISRKVPQRPFRLRCLHSPIIQNGGNRRTPKRAHARESSPVLGPIWCWSLIQLCSGRLDDRGDRGAAAPHPLSCNSRVS